MSADPAHKAMLYFFEVLMNSNGPLTISQLAGRFGSRNFTSEMRTAAGGNESGLKKFLLKYPSLFTVKGNMVSLFDGKSDDAGEGGSGSSGNVRSLPDVSVELDAVQYFQTKLIKKEERWVQIRSLAGHLSQAPLPIREVVGPQLEFKAWLIRHPHIFEVQGELVGLRDGVAAVATPAIPRKIQFVDTPTVVKYAPKTPPPTRKNAPKTPPAMRRSHSFNEKQMKNYIQRDENREINQTRNKRDTPVTLTANEYKAVMFLKDVIEKKGSIKMTNITGYFSQADESVRNTIGWTKMELEEFLQKHSNMFSCSDDELVTLRSNKMNAIIVGSKTPNQSVRTLQGRNGKIYHVAKLWGIIDLGKHEHVFFDKSILKKPLDDLQKGFSSGETLFFNAVQAPKSSRAKWRATHVWKESDNTPTLGELDLSTTSSTTSSNPMLSPSLSIEDEINSFLPSNESEINLASVGIYSDSKKSSTGSVPVWNFGSGENKAGVTTSKKVTMVPENYLLSESSLADMKALSDQLISRSNHKAENKTNGTTETAKINGTTDSGASTEKTKKYVDMACQTISTGDIIATQLYYEA